MLYREGARSCEFKWHRQRLYAAAAAAMLHELAAAAPGAVVTAVEGNRKSRWAPTPLSTLEMQKRGSQVGWLEDGHGGVWCNWGRCGLGAGEPEWCGVLVW